MLGSPLRQAVARWAAATIGFFTLFAGAFWISLPSAVPLRKRNPATTAIMEARAAEARSHGRPPHREWVWVPLSRISVWLERAVVNSEDSRFFEHDGIDLEETGNAIGDALETGHLGRGASTITQQLAKNLWLGEQRSLLRKLREMVLARRLERLGKERVLELYLNIAEWGPGIYGAEAAARAWFGKSAADIRPEEAAVLAAMLPAPRKRNPWRPSARLRTRAFQVLSMYRMYEQLSPERYHRARDRLEDLVGARETARR